MKTKKKKFECLPECKNQKISIIITECDKCIKHISIIPTEKQSKKILEILRFKDFYI